MVVLFPQVHGNYTTKRCIVNHRYGNHCNSGLGWNTSECWLRVVVLNLVPLINRRADLVTERVIAVSTRVE